MRAVSHLKKGKDPRLCTLLAEILENIGSQSGSLEAYLMTGAKVLSCHSTKVNMSVTTIEELHCYPFQERHILLTI